MTAWLQDVIYAFVDKDHKKQMVQKGAHRIGDVVKGQCFLFQCDSAMIKYDNF